MERILELKRKNERKAGIILHPTSLPGPWGIGDIGSEAFKFIDVIADAGIRIWQILPLTPTGSDGCPYNSFSAFAGNELLIDIAALQKKGLIPENIRHPGFNDKAVDYQSVIPFKLDLISRAAQNFSGSSISRSDFEKFRVANKWWLDDYAVYKAISDSLDNVSWKIWPEGLKKKEKKAVDKFAKEHQAEILRYQFGQWLFFSQWKELKTYANSKNVEILGDIPIFLSFDSADVWANQDIFKMADGVMSEISGVPPDYFSEDGQLWGNPLYDWEVLAKSGFRWWVDRFRHNLTMYDMIRLDHFRGFSEYWAVPASESTARNGVWKKTPGSELFTTVFDRLGEFSVIAEDLGNIDEKVKDLKKEFNFPGMKVLHFAFYGGTDHEFLPHNFTGTNCAVYTGTHDNDTTVGWYWSATDDTRRFINHYLDTDGHEINWKMIRLALSSIADKAFFPLQDVLGWGSDCRFNIPGTTGPHNWTWRFRHGDLAKAHIDRLRGIIVAYNRM